MKALLINQDLTISGASLMLHRVARFLVSRGVDVDVLSLVPAAGPLAALYREIGVGTVEKAQLKSYGLCIANTIFAAGPVAGIGPHVPTVWWIHEGDNGLDFALADPGLYRRAFAAAARVVFPAAHLKDCIYKSFIHPLPEERLAILPNGVELPAPIVPMDKPAGVTRVVSVATLDQRKCAGDLLEALERVDRPGLEAVFIGRHCWISDGGQAVLERERQGGRDRFRILGELSHDQAMAWLASADLFCHPARIEAHPLAPLEAGLLGKPIILADIPVYAGLWQHGRNCLLHPGGDIDLLALELDGLCARPALAARLGAAAQATAQRFSHADFLRRFEDTVLAGLL